MRETDLAGLAPVEIEALLSLNRAGATLRHEWESSRATFGRMITVHELAEEDSTCREGGVDHYLQATDDMSNAASEHEETVAKLVWRCISALTVLSISVLERLVAHRGPLPAGEVKRLSTEPTLAQLHASLSLSSQNLLVARDSPSRESYDKEHGVLLKSVENAYGSILRRRPELTRQEAGERLLSEASEPGHDPLYVDLVVFMAPRAEQLVNEIGYYLRRTPAADDVQA